MSQPPPAGLSVLASELKFELAVGLNGRVWVNGESPPVTVLVSNVLQKCTLMPQEAQREAAQKMVAAFRAMQTS